MSKKLLNYEMIWFTRKVKRKLSGHPLDFDYYAGKKVITHLQDANDLIRQRISCPYLIIRHIFSTTIFSPI